MLISFATSENIANIMLKINRLAFVLFLISVSFTELRMDEFPIGLSELMFIIYSLTLVLCGNKFSSNKLVLMLFVLIYYVYLLSSNFTVIDKSLVNILAISYALIVIILSTSDIHLYLKSAIFFLLINIALLISIFAPIDIGLRIYTSPVEGFRYHGFAENPNQTAFAVLFFIYITLIIRYLYNANYYFLLIGLFIIGVLTQSDAFILSVLGGFGFLVAYNYMPRRIFILDFSVFLAMSPLFVFIILEEFNVFNLKQANVRFQLWINGLAAFSESPLFGNGLYAQSGILSPFLNKEAHNTAIDIMSQQGVFGLLVYMSCNLLILFSISSLPDYKLRGVLYSFFIAIFIFSQFHYLLRNPLLMLSAFLVVSMSIKLRKKHVRYSWVYNRFKS